MDWRYISFTLRFYVQVTWLKTKKTANLTLGKTQNDCNILFEENFCLFFIRVFFVFHVSLIAISIKKQCIYQS